MKVVSLFLAVVALGSQLSCGLPIVKPTEPILLEIEIQRSSERGYDCTLRNPTQVTWVFYSGSKESPDLSLENWNERTEEFEVSVVSCVMANFWTLNPGEEIECNVVPSSPSFRVTVRATPIEHPTLKGDSVEIIGEMHHCR